MLSELLQHSKANQPGGAPQRLGAHLSVAGGIENAFHAGARVGCDCLQIFVKNQRQWSAPPLSSETIESCREAAEQTGLQPIVAHASYLLNFASPQADLRKRSIAALVDELQRCAKLGVAFLVMHPGAHTGDGIDTGIKRIASSMNQVHRRTVGCETQVLLETTAGQGSSIGHEVEHLGRIIDLLKEPLRLGVCVDTCHVFAAGYDIRCEVGYDRLFDELAHHVGLDRIKCFHVNDSLRPCGSRVDRHDHIGKGRIGKEGFRRLMNDPRVTAVPKILETPKGTDGRGTDLDRVNLKRLRALIEVN